MKKPISVFFGIFFSLSLCTLIIFGQDDKTVSGGVLNGKAVNLVKPAYPPAARAVGAGGSVRVEIIIDEKGNVVSANVVSGHPLLKQVAEKAATESKFAPTFLNDKPVKVKGILVYNFMPAEKVKTDANTTTPQNVTGGVVNGKAISLPKPEYPPAARAVGAEGTVNVQVTIDEKGNVISAKAVSGHPLLLMSAENAAKEAKFAPTKLEDKAVKVAGIIVYNFSATEDKSVEGGVLNGKAISLPKPEYPAEAKKAKAAGAVNVQVVIDKEGNVISANAVSGHQLLREAAEKAAREAKFEPTFLAGQPVKVSGIIVYNFVAL